VQTHFADRNATATPSAAPTNKPPTATFTSAVTGNNATFNASRSSDADGSISSYAWNFGDGATGTSVNPTHTYAATATYTVKLTVTDNLGASGTTSAPVTIATANGSTLASDNFARTITSGWGSADTGGAWTVSSAAAFAVTGSAGAMTLAAAGTSRNAYLNAVSSTSTDVRVNVSLDKAPTGGGTYVTVVGRKVAGVGEYRAKVLLAAGGAVKIQVVRSDASNTETALGSQVTVSGLTYTPGMVLQLRVAVTGTGSNTINAKVWDNTATEPPSWPVTASDTNAGMGTGGGIGVIGYASGSTTNAPLTISFSHLQAIPAT
jgi:PKD repeat protein